MAAMAALITSGCQSLLGWKEGFFGPDEAGSDRREET